MAEQSSHHDHTPSGEKDPETPNIINEIGAILKIPKHGEETHGTSDDIHEDTPIDEVKGPGVFQRAKEEIEALVSAILPKKK